MHVLLLNVLYNILIYHLLLITQFCIISSSKFNAIRTVPAFLTQYFPLLVSQNLESCWLTQKCFSTCFFGALFQCKRFAFKSCNFRRSSFTFFFFFIYFFFFVFFFLSIVYAWFCFFLLASCQCYHIFLHFFSFWVFWTLLSISCASFESLSLASLQILPSTAVPISSHFCFLFNVQ